MVELKNDLAINGTLQSVDQVRDCFPPSLALSPSSPLPTPLPQSVDQASDSVTALPPPPLFASSVLQRLVCLALLFHGFLSPPLSPTLSSLSLSPAPATVCPLGAWSLPSDGVLSDVPRSCLTTAALTRPFPSHRFWGVLWGCSSSTSNSRTSLSRTRKSTRTWWVGPSSARLCSGSIFAAGQSLQYNAIPRS